MSNDNNNSEYHNNHPRLSTLRNLQNYVKNHNEANDKLKKSFWSLTKSRHNSRSFTLVETQFQPDLIREELVATTRVLSITKGEEKEEPNLLSEDDLKEKDIDNEKKMDIIKKDVNQSSATSPPVFRLVDTLVLESKNNQTVTTKEDGSLSTTIKEKNNDVNEDSTTTSDVGLRQRKKNANVVANSSNNTDQDDKKTTSSGDNNSSKDKKSSSTTIKTIPSNESWTIVDHPSSSTQQQNHDPIELFGGGLTPRDLKIAQQNAKDALEIYIKAANDVASILQILNQQQQQQTKRK